MGPDRAKAIADAYSASCQAVKDTNCFNAVADAWGFGTGQEENGIGRRMPAAIPGGWVGAALVVVVGILSLPLLSLDNRESRIHIESIELDKIKTMGDASTYVFAPATSGPAAITVPVTPAPTPAPL